MAKAVQKIKLSPSRDIPFNKLVLSQSNVRQIKDGISIEHLAESIAQRTLLQSLNVRAVLDADGNETGMFEVPAGGRRYRALELLVKQKRMGKTEPVPCVVREGGIAEDDSLAENEQRVGLHPLDQFRAFKALHDRGMTEEDIAARHFVTAHVVKQRLRLASVSPKLLDIYAADEMDLEQLMAFTVCEDHARQEQVWDDVSRSGYDHASSIRRALTENKVPATDRRVLFVGLDAYKQAGGYLVPELFVDEHGGYLEDVALLDRLVTEKLKTEAEVIAAKEGWKWVSAAVSFPYNHSDGLREIHGEPIEITAEEQASLDALQAEYAKLEAEHEDADEYPPEVDQRLGEIEKAVTALENRPYLYDPADVARAGVFIDIDADGELYVDRGYVRPEDDDAETDGESEESDETQSEAARSGVSRATITVGTPDAEPEQDEDSAPAKGLPDRLVAELTAHRTLALQNAVACNPHVALTVLLHKLCRDTFHTGYVPGCLEASVRHVHFREQGPDLKECLSAKQIEERDEAWETDVPKDDQALWDWLDNLDDARRAALLAHCIAYGINALHEKIDRHGGTGISEFGLRQRLAQANRLARAANLDMVEAGWTATVGNYLGRVSKAQILDAVREAKGEAAAQLIDHLKKGEMAKEAERLLEDTGWLPEPLRLADLELVHDDETDAEALPEFLDDDEAEPAEAAE
jgi:ParB family chromosome partitioning protein